MPVISIVTPAYNAAAFLPFYFSSLAQQTFTDYEVLIVDDTSVDGTGVLVEQAALRDGRIRLLTLQQNLGAAGARNEGLRQARGDYVCFLDVDDYWLPEKLATQLAFMRSHACQLSYMDYLRVDEQRQPLTRVTAPEQTDYADMLKSNRIGNLTAMFSRQAAEGLQFRRIGHEDYVFWLELLRRVHTARKVVTSEPLCCYMVRPRSLSSNKFKAASWQWAIYREVLGLPLFRAVWYMTHYALASVSKRV